MNRAQTFVGITYKRASSPAYKYIGVFPELTGRKKIEVKTLHQTTRVYMHSMDKDCRQEKKNKS